MKDFDTEVAGIGRQRAIAFFVPRLAALVVLGVVLAALLAGCNAASSPESPNQPDSVWLDVDTDALTGCQYIGRRNSSAGITPRIAADGKTHMGCKAVAP